MSSLYQDPNWPRANRWLSGEHAPNPIGRLAILGAPAKLGSISPGRCDLAPRAVRSALGRFSTYDFDGSRDVQELAAQDLGDLDEITNLTVEQMFPRVRDAVSLALEDANAVVLLGGDNSITRPGCHALAPLNRSALLTVDAHLDLRDLSNGLTNGNPVRALLADGLPGRHILQIGIQSFANSKTYADVAREAGITVIPVERVFERGIDSVVSDALARLSSVADAIYLDLDLDVLDRSYAPATPGSRPGGLAPWQIRRAARLCGAHPKLRVMDLVEIDPEKDIADSTSLAAAACLLSFAAGVHERLKP